MPPWVSLSRAARLTPTIFIPLRPFLFVARRTLIFCAAILISYVLVTNMIGYERIWSNSIPSFGTATTTTTTTTVNGAQNANLYATTGNRRRPHRTESSRNEEDEKTAGNDTIDRNAQSNVNELEASDLIVDQPEPRLQDENGTRSAAKVARTGDVVESDKNGAQVIETILLNRTLASVNEELRQQSMDNQGFTKTHSAAKLPICPMPPPDLIGKMKQSVLLMSMLKESDVVRAHPELSRGGHWKPDNCKARYKIAVIVPFRDRQSHLNRLIDFLIPMMERQLLDFRFIVTEQYGKDLFNKGRIMNAAFVLAEKLGVDCVIFHDVDMFPQDDRNLYYCPDEPKHLGAFVNTLGYELWYDYIVGGVLAINVEHYRQVNGYSNMYWAWGGEDDDMGYRILANNLTIERPQKEYGTYTMLKHVKRQRTAPSMIYKLLNTAKTRWTTDGLSQVDWKVVKLIVKPLYYHLYVDVGVPPDEWRYEKPTK